MRAVASRAFLLSVGDELLAGAHADTNSSEIARRLAELGIETLETAIVSDDEEPLAGALSRGLARAELVIATGGLGPTLDDQTRHAIARACGRDLVESPEARAQVEGWYALRARAMPQANLRQALVPRGAEVLRNRIGTAPGFVVDLGERVVAALPGPPFEMRVLLEEELVPWLDRAGRLPTRAQPRRFFLYGIPESEFAERVGAWMARDAEPLMGVTAEDGVLSVVLRSREPDRDRGERALEARARAFRARLGAHVYSESEARLESVLGRALITRAISVTTAESCTAGLVAALLTRVPGISSVFHEGFVTYADTAKSATLQVSADLLARHGAVSEPVARAMVEGAARRTGARLALSVTGIAGPAGGSIEKPVGLVWIGSSLDGMVEARSFRFPPTDRERVRAFAARAALHEGLRRLSSG